MPTGGALEPEGYLYGGDGGGVALQHGDGGAGPQAPHPDHLVAAGRRHQRVLVVHRHVGDLSGVAAERGQQPPVVRGPDLHQAVV